MSYPKIYTIEDGIIFKGTLRQFRRDGYFPGPCNESDIIEWCHDNDYEFTITPADEHNPHNMVVAGYANKTAIHPVGSYIGFEKGPTVFATPVVYLSEAQDIITDLEEQIEDLKEQLQQLRHIEP